MNILLGTGVIMLQVKLLLEIHLMLGYLGLGSASRYPSNSPLMCLEGNK